MILRKSKVIKVSNVHGVHESPFSSSSHLNGAQLYLHSDLY